MQRSDGERVHGANSPDHKSCFVLLGAEKRTADVCPAESTTRAPLLLRLYKVAFLCCCLGRFWGLETGALFVNIDVDDLSIFIGFVFVDL